jgi:hypothetical protein
LIPSHNFRKLIDNVDMPFDNFPFYPSLSVI